MWRKGVARRRGEDLASEGPSRIADRFWNRAFMDAHFDALRRPKLAGTNVGNQATFVVRRQRVSGCVYETLIHDSFCNASSGDETGSPAMVTIEAIRRLPLSPGGAGILIEGGDWRHEG
jgi:hypothetical protein